MIKLSGSLRGYSTTFNHTGFSSGTNYTITHNLNTSKPNIVINFIDIGGNVQRLTPYVNLGPETYGHFIGAQTLSAFTLTIFRFSPSVGSGATTQSVTVTVTSLE